MADRRVEYQYKNDKIKDLKKDYKQAIADTEHKKKVLTYMQQEHENLPKDINRNQFLKRINEVIKTLKGQKVDIKSVLNDVKEIQNDTQEVARSTAQIDHSVEEVIFKDANEKKDKLAKDIYEEVQNLKTNFDKVITCV